MADILSGLEKLGLGNVKDIEVYSKDEKADNGNSASAKASSSAEAVPKESDFIFEKGW